MHPPLAKHLHPMCGPVIDELHECHADHPVKKFIGACNDAAKRLDACLYEEVCTSSCVWHASGEGHGNDSSDCRRGEHGGLEWSGLAQRLYSVLAVKLHA